MNIMCVQASACDEWLASHTFDRRSVPEKALASTLNWRQSTSGEGALLGMPFARDPS